MPSLAHLKHRLREAATLKSNARRLARDLDALLADKSLPAKLRQEITDVRGELRRTWTDLAADAEPVEAAVAEAAAPAAMDAAECGPSYYSPAQGAKSFADLAAARAAQEKASNVNDLTWQYQDLVYNIMHDEGDGGTKIAALRGLADEFIDLVTEALNEAAREPAPAEPRATLSESESGGALRLVEAELAGEGTGVRSPLDLDVKLIVPGWGNKRDNNFYPAEVLRRDAGVFTGAKMYATDHRENEKSVRTEVSRIKEITGFADDGAPIARVTIFDPDFAEQTRNRNKAGILESLECSILAFGTAKPGTAPDGRAGNIVESITQAQSVDWVTRAGAGGKALRLAEADSGEAAKGNPMMLSEQEVATALAQSSLPETAKTALASKQYADAAALAAVIEAVEAGLGTPNPDPNAGAAAGAAAPAQTPPANGVAEADVTAALAKTQLPEPARQRLAEAKYADKAALDAAIAAEVAYLKSVTGSGKPVVTAPKQPAARSLAEVDKTVDGVLDKHFGPTGRPARK